MKELPNKYIDMNNEQIKKETFDRYRKIRKSWSISPVTKIKKSKKLYKRSKNKREIDAQIKEEI